MSHGWQQQKSQIQVFFILQYSKVPAHLSVQGKQVDGSRHVIPGIEAESSQCWNIYLLFVWDIWNISFDWFNCCFAALFRMRHLWCVNQHNASVEDARTCFSKGVIYSMNCVSWRYATKYEIWKSATISARSQNMRSKISFWQNSNSPFLRDRDAAKPVKAFCVVIGSWGKMWR